MSGILVVTAVDIETRGLARRLGLARASDVEHLRYRGDNLEIVCAGPRAARLPQLTPLSPSVSLVVSAGTCGALAPHLSEGDLVVPEIVLTSQGQRLRMSATPGLQQWGSLLSVDRVVETAEAKARLWEETAALAIDMESAAVLAWTQALGVPAIAIRGVSDAANRAVPAALAALVDSEGRTRMVRAVRTVFAHPRTLPHALALRRGTAAALRRVATAVRVLTAARNSTEIRDEQIGRGPSGWRAGTHGERLGPSCR